MSIKVLSILKPFWARLTSKFPKNAEKIKTHKNSVRVSRNAIFYAEFKSVDKVAKNFTAKRLLT
jgi:hypothetical protein